MIVVHMAWADRGGGGGPGGPDPPFFGPRCRLFNIGSKVGPPSGFPFFFACRHKMDPPFSKILDPSMYGKYQSHRESQVLVSPN